MGDFFVLTLSAGTPFILASLGEIFTQKSGVLNIGIEGMMLIGALVGFSVAHHSGSPWIGLFGGVIAGSLGSLIHGFLSITLMAPQVISGMALTIFGFGITSFLGKPFLGLPATSFETSILGVTPPVLIALALVPVSGFILTKTGFGIHIRAVGEYPEAADSAGVNVRLTRYICVLIGGGMAGLSGAYLSLAYSPMWREGMTAGRGWIALSLVFFSMRKPTFALLGAIVFGSLWILQFKLQGVGLGVSPYLLMMIPYASTIFVLSVVSSDKIKRRIGTPEALGKPYVR